MPEFLPFDGTCASPVATSLVTLEWANGYVSARGVASDEWSAADDTTKEGALLVATRVIESMTFIGEKLTTFQRLSWPRNVQGASSTTYTVTGVPAADSITIDEIKEDTSFPDGHFSGGSIYFHDEGNNQGLAYTIKDFSFSTGNITAVSDFGELVSVDDFVTLNTPILDDVRSAVVEMAIHALEEGVDRDGGVKREKLDTEEVEYFDRSSTGESLFDTTPIAQQLIGKYIKSNAIKTWSTGVRYGKSFR